MYTNMNTDWTITDSNGQSIIITNIEYKLYPNIYCRQGWIGTLVSACQNNNVDVIEWLLSETCYTNLLYSEKYTETNITKWHCNATLIEIAFMNAYYYNYTDIINILLLLLFCIRDSKYSLVKIAQNKKDLSMITYLFSLVDKCGMFAHHVFEIACQIGDFTIMKIAATKCNSSKWISRLIETIFSQFHRFDTKAINKMASFILNYHCITDINQLQLRYFFDNAKNLIDENTHYIKSARSLQQ